MEREPEEKVVVRVPYDMHGAVMEEGSVLESTGGSHEEYWGE